MAWKKPLVASCPRLGGDRVATLQRHAQAKSRGFSGVRVVLETRRNSINISICSFCFWRWIRTARTFQPTKFQCRESNIEKKNPRGQTDSIYHKGSVVGVKMSYYFFAESPDHKTES